MRTCTLHEATPWDVPVSTACVLVCDLCMRRGCFVIMAVVVQALPVQSVSRNVRGFLHERRSSLSLQLCTALPPRPCHAGACAAFAAGEVGPSAVHMPGVRIGRRWAVLASPVKTVHTGSHPHPPETAEVNKKPMDGGPLTPPVALNLPERVYTPHEALWALLNNKIW